MTDHRADHRADRQQDSIASALRHAGLTIEELWLRYFALGGNAGLVEIDAYVHGLGELPPLQPDVLAHAVNERLDELTPPHRAEYSRQTRETSPRGRSLSALVALLEGAELAPPDRLKLLVDGAAQALDVRITMYLVDYEERHLHRWSAGSTHDGEHDGEHDGARLGVDSTLPGRAFRQVRILPSRTDGRHRLWVPLLDGVERLGVLDVQVDDPSDLHDPGLRAQCRWLSMLLGHLVTLLTQYGDAVDLVRLPTLRTVSGELIWSLLPPLTAGVDSFVVTGVVEPRHGVNGDVFDYSLSETTATLLVLDAVGHNLRSGLIAATALAAHRQARHAGQDLRGQARTIDETISTQFGRSTFVTAVLAEVDLATGRLRYLNAGHPEPLILRGGRVVKPLTAGHTPPLGLGLGLGERAVAEELLQPDDWLVLYSDGITEARNARGEFFGETRLADFLHREAAAGNPPPETARRLMQAILTHQGGVFQDDASVVLARWTNPRVVLP
ncbi:PP2C family protein-serine/threonine phosphatase [Saccharothrix isguenensis]